MNDIVDEARTWLGVPWVHQGRSRDGIDCAGLAQQVAAAVRGYAFDITNYAAQATDETMLALCAEHMDSVRLNAMEPGDIVVVRFGDQRHMGLIGDYPHGVELSLIHASTYFNKVVEHRLDGVWRRRCLAAFRLRDMRGETS